MLANSGIASWDMVGMVFGMSNFMMSGLIVSESLSSEARKKGH